jgi:hypothetical protein
MKYFGGYSQNSAGCVVLRTDAPGWDRSVVSVKRFRLSQKSLESLFRQIGRGWTLHVLHAWRLSFLIHEVVFCDHADVAELTNLTLPFDFPEKGQADIEQIPWVCSSKAGQDLRIGVINSEIGHQTMNGGLCRGSLINDADGLGTRPRMDTVVAQESEEFPDDLFAIVRSNIVSPRTYRVAKSS